MAACREGEAAEDIYSLEKRRSREEELGTRVEEMCVTSGICWMGGDRHMTFVTRWARLAQRIPKMIKASSLLLVSIYI